MEIKTYIGEKIPAMPKTHAVVRVLPLRLLTLLRSYYN